MKNNKKKNIGWKYFVDLKLCILFICAHTWLDISVEYLDHKLLVFVHPTVDLSIFNTFQRSTATYNSLPWPSLQYLNLNTDQLAQVYWTIALWMRLD